MLLYRFAGRKKKQAEELPWHWDIVLYFGKLKKKKGDKFAIKQLSPSSPQCSISIEEISTYTFILNHDWGLSSLVHTQPFSLGFVTAGWN